MTELSVAHNSCERRLLQRAKDIFNFLRSGTFYAMMSMMLWMEMIRLRTTHSRLDNVAGLLINAMNRASGEAGLVQVHMYNNASYQTDLALSLTCDTNSFRREGSRAALTISEALKTFGLVEHSVWVEKETG